MTRAASGTVGGCDAATDANRSSPTKAVLITRVRETTIGIPTPSGIVRLSLLPKIIADGKDTRVGDKWIVRSVLTFDLSGHGVTAHRDVQARTGGAPGLLGQLQGERLERDHVVLTHDP